MMEIGVLALQGDFIEHYTILQSLGVAAAFGEAARSPGRPGWSDHSWR